MRIGFATPKSTATAVAAGFRSNSRERLADRNGDLNAGSTRELLQTMVEIAQRLDRGEFVEEANEIMTPAERRETLVAAFNDQSGQQMREIGASITSQLQEHVARAGFARQLLSRGDVAQGAFPRVRVRQRTVEAVIANGPANVSPAMVRDNYVYPAEFNIIVNLMIEQREMAQGSSDLLQEKFDEAQEAFLVGEDRTFIRMADLAAPMLNNQQVFVGELSPAVIAAAQNQVATWSLPHNTMLMAINLLPDVATGSTFSTFVDPVSKLEVIMTGRLGTLLGMTLMTDGYRDQRLRVVANNTFYIFTSPDYLGAYTDRGPIQAEPTGSREGQIGRGWLMSELISMAVANPKGVAKGYRA